MDKIIMDIFDLAIDFLKQQKLYGKKKVYISAENLEIFKNFGITTLQDSQVLMKNEFMPEKVKPNIETKVIAKTEPIIKTKVLEKIEQIVESKVDEEISTMLAGKTKNPQILFIEETVNFVKNQFPFFLGFETLQKMTQNVLHVDWQNVATLSLIKPKTIKNNFDFNEIENLLRNLLAQIAPQFIVICSSITAKSLLKNFTPINQSHGILKSYQNIPTIEIFHPEYLNRFPQFKKETMPDLKLIKKTLDAKILR